MDLVASLQRSYSELVLQKEIPKWLSVFLSKGLPQIVSLLLVLIIAQQAAVMTWKFIPEPPQRALPSNQEVGKERMAREQQTSERTADRIADLHLFGQAGEVKPVVKEQVDDKAPETRLKLTLHGVFVEQDPNQGAAIIGKEGSKQDYYKVGGSIMNGVTLQAVFDDRVVLLRNGQSEILKFPKTAKPAEVPQTLANAKSSGSSSESLSSYRDIFKNEPLKIFEHVRFIPVRSGRTVKGYRVLPQKNRKLYNQLGIRPSDLVTAVNGVSLQNDKEALQLIDQLKDANQLNLDIIRRGQQESLSISLN